MYTNPYNTKAEEEEEEEEEVGVDSIWSLHCSP